MKTKMALGSLTLLLTLAISDVAEAQGLCNCDPDLEYCDADGICQPLELVPIDGGTGLLLATGVVYGIRKLRKKQMQISDRS
jgi:hypothetical protein